MGVVVVGGFMEDILGFGLGVNPLELGGGGGSVVGVV